MENNNGGSDKENGLYETVAQNTDPVNKPSDVSENKESTQSNKEHTEIDKSDSNQPLLKDDLLSITSFLIKLEKDLNLRNERDRYKDEAIQRMTKQVEQYEKGLLKKIKEPIIRDLILLSDSIEKLRKKFSDIDIMDLNNDLILLQDELDEILYINSVEKMNSNDIYEYDKDHQKVVKKIMNDNKDNDRKIIEVTKPGYLWENEVIRKQEIVIYEYIENKKNN
jgi:molecular chaperone GrpE (heat shock protein)